MTAPRQQPSLDELEEGVRAGNRALLARAITLVESTHPEHERRAQELLHRLLPHAGRSLRVGFTGVPGVGKSTLVDELGSRLTARGHRLAVLAVDPSSTVSRGSILGDKTRMARLGVDDAAFVRPSPAAGSLGGVARKTRESMLVCEAAGYDVIFVETVGVGQSEVSVHSMVDTFALFLLSGGGDELQGIKRGIVELADVIAINKADGDNVQRAKRARVQYERALHFLAPDPSGWQVKVLTCSGRDGDGVDELWETIEAHRDHAQASGSFAARRSTQNLEWMRALVDERLRGAFYRHPEVRRLLPELEAQVGSGTLTPTAAAIRLVDLVDGPASGEPPD